MCELIHPVGYLHISAGQAITNKYNFQAKPRSIHVMMYVCVHKSS